MSNSDQSVTHPGSCSDDLTDLLLVRALAILIPAQFVLGYTQYGNEPLLLSGSFLLVALLSLLYWSKTRWVKPVAKTHTCLIHPVVRSLYVGIGTTAGLSGVGIALSTMI